MALVIFLRGVNVGGHRTFRPSVLGQHLSHLGVVNVGAAGTFIIRKRCSAMTVRAQFAAALEFPTEIMVCRGQDLLNLVARDPFGRQPAAGELRRCISVLKNKPRIQPKLPLDIPPSDSWQVRFIELSGPFALAWWRRLGTRFVEPNTVAERSFGVTATTRNWNTIIKVAAVLQSLREKS